MLTRGRLRVPRRLIPALLLLATSGDDSHPPPSEAIAELHRHGLLEGGALRPSAAEVVTVMTEPTLVVSVDVSDRDGRRRSTVWATQDAAVWGRPLDDDVYEMRTVGPGRLPLLLAQLVGIGRRPAAPFTGGVAVPDDALTAALEWRGRDPETSLGILVAAGVDPVWADRLLIAHDHAKARWTVSSVWGDDDSHLREVTILDAGPGGYWQLEPSADRPATTYRVVSLAETMRRLRGCLPDRLDFKLG